MNTHRAVVIIGWAALITGGLDFAYITLTFLFSGRSVERLWQYVASGVFGQDAFSMGTAGALWGVLFHFSIMAIFSAFMFLLYRKIPVVAKWPFYAGLVYGFGMWLVMNMLVVPLSRAGHGLIPLKVAMLMNIGFVMHLIFGLAIVLVIRRGLADRPSLAGGQPQRS
jgi:hypothetical protein